MGEVLNPKTGLAALPKCRLCRGTNRFTLDMLQVPAARQRWQWADLDGGVNCCPCSYPEGRFVVSYGDGKKSRYGPTYAYEVNDDIYGVQLADDLAARAGVGRA